VCTLLIHSLTLTSVLNISLRPPTDIAYTSSSDDTTGESGKGNSRLNPQSFDGATGVDADGSLKGGGAPITHARSGHLVVVAGHSVLRGGVPLKDLGRDIADTPWLLLDYQRYDMFNCPIIQL
jgi:hypothetical protein